MLINNFALSFRIGKELKKRQLRLALAESCTGGGLAREITAVSGSSGWFECGFVVYSNEAKMNLLGVSKQTLEQYGAVSEQTAAEMAKGVLQRSCADVGLSVTGIAGPGGGTEGKPVGIVCFGIAHKDGRCNTMTAHFTSGRKYIRESATNFAFQALLDDLALISTEL